MSDATPPPAPKKVRLQRNKVTWEAEADLESGLASFIFERDSEVLAAVPEAGKNPFGRPVFQNLQYSDTPTEPLVPMQFVNLTSDPARKHAYRVIAVNTVGLKSKPSAEARPRQRRTPQPMVSSTCIKTCIDWAKTLELNPVSHGDTDECVPRTRLDRRRPVW